MFQSAENREIFCKEMIEYVKYRTDTSLGSNQSLFGHTRDACKRNHYEYDFVPDLVKYEHAYGSFAKIDEHIFSVLKAKAVRKIAENFMPVGLGTGVMLMCCGASEQYNLKISAAPFFLVGTLAWLSSIAFMGYVRYQDVKIEFAKSEISRLTDQIANTDPKNIKSI